MMTIEEAQELINRNPDFYWGFRTVERDDYNVDDRIFENSKSWHDIATSTLTDEERATLSDVEQDALFETRSDELNTKANAARDIVDRLLLDLDDRDRLETYTGGYTVLRVDYENNSEEFWNTSEWFAARCRSIWQEDDGSKLVLTDEDGDEIVDRLESAPGWNDDAAPTYAPHPILIERDATRERLSEIFAEL